MRRGEAAALIRETATSLPGSQLPRLHLSVDAAAGRCAAPPPVNIGSPWSGANLPGFDPVFLWSEGARPETGTPAALACVHAWAPMATRSREAMPSVRPSVDPPVHVHGLELNCALPAGLGGQR